MKVAVFSTKSYDQEYLDKYNTNYGFDFSYFDTPLNPQTAKIANGFDAVCVFVNDIVDSDTLNILAENGVRLLHILQKLLRNMPLP